MGSMGKYVDGIDEFTRLYDEKIYPHICCYVSENKGDHYWKRLSNLKHRVLDLQNDQLPVSVVIAGQFSSGKSSVINSLIGKELIPSGDEPMTAVPTYFQYGPKEKIEMLFINGNRENIDIGEFQNIKHGGKIPQGLKRLRIQYPATSLSKLIIIDTPGFSTANQIVDDEITRDIIRHEADVLVWVVDAEHGTLKQDAIDELDGLVSKSASDMSLPIIVLANKMDLVGKLNGKKCNDILKEIKEQSKIEKIIPYSARSVIQNNNKSRQDFGTSLLTAISENVADGKTMHYNLQYCSREDNNSLTIYNKNNIIFEFSSGSKNLWAECLRKLQIEVDKIRDKTQQYSFYSVERDFEIIKIDIKKEIEQIEQILIKQQNNLELTTNDAIRRIEQVIFGLEKEYQSLYGQFKWAFGSALTPMFLEIEVIGRFFPFSDDYKIKNVSVEYEVFAKKTDQYLQKLKEKISKDLEVTLYGIWKSVCGESIEKDLSKEKNVIFNVLEQLQFMGYRACCLYATLVSSVVAKGELEPKYREKNAFKTYKAEELYRAGSFDHMFYCARTEVMGRYNLHIDHIKFVFTEESYRLNKISECLQYVKTKL